MINAGAVAVQGIGYGSMAVASQGFLGGATLQQIEPGSLLMTMAFGTPTVGAPPLQTISPGSLLMTQGIGLPTINGGNVAARWFWVKVWQPLWTWIDSALGHDPES